MSTLFSRGSTSRRIALVVLVLAAAYAPFYFAPFRVFQLTMVMVYAMTLIGLALLTGFNGQISLGHAAFFAVGAYTSAIMLDAGLPLLLTVVVGTAVSFVLGLGFGFPALRLHGPYLALLTLALAVVTPPLLKRFSSVTGGSMGLSVSKPTAPDWTGLANDQWLYLVVLVLLVLAVALARNLVSSRIGRAMISIRENPTAAEAMGVDVSRVKVSVFAWSAGYAGLSGVVFTWVIGFVAPDTFTVVLSITFLASLVVGGVASIAGAVVGAAFMLYVPSFAENISDAAPGVIAGLTLIIVMFVAPYGLVGLAVRLWRRFTTGRGATGPAGPGGDDTAAETSAVAGSTPQG